MVRSIKVENRPQIKKIIHYVKPKKSSGYDEITNEILKACASLISHPLSYIYSHSLYTGIFPDQTEIAVVKPLYKKRDKPAITNYRPVSLLTVSSNVLEKAVHSTLSQQLNSKNMLVTEQYSFKKGISTEDAAFRKQIVYSNLLTKKCMLEEFSVTWLRLLIV
jgi:hypothetical protein